MISSELVDQACAEVNGYTDDRMMAEFDAFFKEQPSICDFITELTSESSLQIQELSLFLSYMVFKTVRCRSPITLAVVTPENIESAYRDSETGSIGSMRKETRHRFQPIPNRISPNTSFRNSISRSRTEDC